MPLPQRIKNAPNMPFGLELFYSAFLDLNTCRPAGWGLQGIPWSAISDYAEVIGIYDEDRDDLFYFVTSLDSAFRDYHDKKTVRESPKNSKKISKT